MSEQILNSRIRGRVRTYNRGKGWGFIRAEDGADYFVHFSRIRMEGFRYLRRDELVEFEPRQAGNKRQAHKVDRLLEVLQTAPHVVRPRQLRRNPFTPANPITTPDQFSGREEQLGLAFEFAYNSQHVIVSGDRGVGKSSFANQICAFMAGNAALLTKLGIPVPPDAPNNVVVRIVCQKDTEISDFMMSVVSACEVALGHVRKSERLEIHLLAFKRTIEVNNPRPAEAGAYVAALVDQISRSGRDPRGVTIRIDEADLVAAADEVPSFLKSICEQVVHYGVTPFNLILVGISGTLTSLIAGHPSTKRLFQPMHLPRMHDAEIRAIIETRLSGSGVAIDEETSARIVHLSDGYPHPAHLLGYFAFDFDSNGIIERDDLENALQHLVTELKAEEFAAIYQSVSPAEYAPIMRLLADPDVDALPSQVIATKLKEDAKAIRSRLGYLNRMEIVDRTREGHYRLQDPLFKIYCRWMSAREKVAI